MEAREEAAAVELILFFTLIAGLGVVSHLEQSKRSEWKEHLPTSKREDIKPLLQELGLKTTDRPFFWQKDLGRRLLSVELRGHVQTYGFGIRPELEVRIPGTPGIGPDYPREHAHARIPFQDGFILSSGASKAVALRLSRVEVEEAVQRLGGPFVEGEIPQFQLRRGWLQWTVPGKFTAEKHNALLKEAIRIARALEEGVGKSVPMDLLDVVLTREGGLRAQALDTLLSDFSETKQATVARTFGKNSSDDVLQLLVELDKEDPAIGLILDLLAGDDIPLWLEARAKTQLQGQEVGGLMLIQPHEAGQLSVSEDVEGALSKPMQSKETIQ
jgi:hypothetical protein